MHTGNDVKYLHCDMFSTYMESIGEDSIAAFRRQYGIILNVCPPYDHHRNHEAEHMIHNCTQHTRTRLRALLNAQVKGQRIPNPNLYWPYAWQHSVQCYNELPNVTLERRWGIICTPWQKFTGNSVRSLCECTPLVNQHGFLLKRTNVVGNFQQSVKLLCFSLMDI